MFIYEPGTRLCHGSRSLAEIRHSCLIIIVHFSKRQNAGSRYKSFVWLRIILIKYLIFLLTITTLLYLYFVLNSCFFILRMVESESGGHRTPRFVFLLLRFTVAHVTVPSSFTPVDGAVCPYVTRFAFLHVLLLTPCYVNVTSIIHLFISSLSIINWIHQL